MDRRSFFATLGKAAVAAVMVPKFADHFRWTARPSGVLVLPNPDWLTAPYEVAFIFTEHTSRSVVRPRSLPLPLKEGEYWKRDMFAPRFTEDGTMVLPYRTVPRTRDICH